MDGAVKVPELSLELEADCFEHSAILLSLNCSVPLPCHSVDLDYLEQFCSVLYCILHITPKGSKVCSGKLLLPCDTSVLFSAKLLCLSEQALLRTISKRRDCFWAWQGSRISYLEMLNDKAPKVDFDTLKEIQLPAISENALELHLSFDT